MNIFLLIGLLSTQGFGYSNQHTVIVAAELRAHGFSVYTDVAPTEKLDAGNGYSFRIRPSVRLGSSWFVQPGAEVKHQVTSTYDKTGVSAMLRAGYERQFSGWTAYGVYYHPLGNFPQWAAGAGFDMQANSGLVGRIEITVGPRVTDGTNTTRQIRSVVLLGYQWSR